MLGRMKMSIEEAEKDYCDLLRKLFQHSNVTQNIRDLLSDDEEADTAYDLMRKIRSLTKDTAEFNTTPIKGYFQGDLKLPDVLLKDPSLDTSLSPCKV